MSPPSSLPTPEERRQRERAEIRTRILDAARELLIAEGPQALSMRKIAERISYTPTALYFHFPDKESLLAALVSADFLKFRRGFSRLEKIAHPVERLARMGRAFVEFGLRNPGHYRIMFMTPETRGHTPEQLTERAQVHGIERGNPSTDSYAYLHNIVAECMAAGVFRPELRDSHLLTQVICAAMHGVVSLYLVKEADLPPGVDSWVPRRAVRTRARLMCETIIRGLVADPARLPPAPEAETDSESETEGDCETDSASPGPDTART